MFRQEIKKLTEKKFTDITQDLQNILFETKVQYGIMHVYSKHTTCGIKILENEILSLLDISKHLEAVVPKKKEYAHDRIELREVPPTERVNAVSHVRMLYIPTSETIPIYDGFLELGKWQRVVLVEMDYQEPFLKRTIIVSILDGGHNGTC